MTTSNAFDFSNLTGNLRNLSNKFITTVKEKPLLPLACCSYRRYKTDNLPKFTSFDSSSVCDYLIADDFKVAEKITNYYKGKITLRLLKLGDRPLTSFKFSLYEFLISGKILEDQLGLVYKLPYFYHTDLALDNLFESANCNILQVSNKNTELSLTPVAKIYSVDRGIGPDNVYQYYWSDSERQMYSIWIKESSDFFMLVDQFYNNSRLDVIADIKPTSTKDYQYSFYQLRNIRLDNV